jgi:hypothetical protein
MATNAITLNVDYRFFDELALYRWPEKSAAEIAVYRDLVDTGEIQIESVLENAIAVVGGLQRVAGHGYDFCDKSDAKKTTSVARNNNAERGQWAHSMPVRRVCAKIGGLRIMGYNSITDQFHYFCIPNYAFSHLLKASSVLEIVIERYTNYAGNQTFTGIPGRHQKWWSFEVPSFHAMATHKF